MLTSVQLPRHSTAPRNGAVATPVTSPFTHVSPAARRICSRAVPPQYCVLGWTCVWEVSGDPVQVMPPPQTFGVPPPPHDCVAVHVPQSRLPPQPSGIMSQLSP